MPNSTLAKILFCTSSHIFTPTLSRLTKPSPLSPMVTWAEDSDSWASKGRVLFLLTTIFSSGIIGTPKTEKPLLFARTAAGPFTRRVSPFVKV
ncbi:MAG: hypothetical protein HXX80_03720 [Nitrososphaerales archaeon]|nr:hypothetical protein [Nitrososphaerales archaeon]